MMLPTTKRSILNFGLLLLLVVPAFAQDDKDYIPTDNYSAIAKRETLKTTAGCDNKEEEIKELKEGWEVLPIFPRPLMRATFPVSNADRIFIAEVKSAELHFDCSRSKVYSQYDLRVEDVLKEGSGVAMSTQNSAKVYNWGGAVRFDSGKVQQYRVHGVKFLEPGKRYAIFVIESNALPTVYTAFELTDGKIVQMNSVGAGRVPDDSPLKNYQTMNEKIFVEELKKLIASPPIGF